MKQLTNHIIIYHSNCMDGLSSAFIANKAINNLKHPDETITLMPLYYQSEYKLFNILDQIEGPVCVTMVDFSFKRPEMLKLLQNKNTHMVKVLDHHDTARKELHNVHNSKLEFVFNKNKSGAIICYEYFMDHHDLEPELFAYVQDRDLWTWELSNSMKVSALLQWEVEKNNLESFESFYNYYINRSKQEIADSMIRAKSYLHVIEKQVEHKTKHATKAIINNKEIMMINATENISELGHSICKEYNLPACMFFYNDTLDKVILSFRSEDHLEPAVNFATSFPRGGGHPNAAGATIPLDVFNQVLKG